MNRQSQWLFERPSASEATYYTNPYTNPEYYNPELEFEYRQSYCPPAQSSEIISGFGAYLSSIPVGEQGKIERSARNIVNSFLPGCRPDQLVRVCLIGHADKDIKRGIDFEAKISFERALEVDKALSKAIFRLLKSDPKLRPVIPLFRYEVLRIGQGAGALVVQNPKNEQERKQNRRVQIVIKSVSRNETCCGIPRSLAQTKQIYASILNR
jgi:hypothetical protein